SSRLFTNGLARRREEGQTVLPIWPSRSWPSRSELLAQIRPRHRVEPDHGVRAALDPLRPLAGGEGRAGKRELRRDRIGGAAPGAAVALLAAVLQQLLPRPGVVVESVLCVVRLQERLLRAFEAASSPLVAGQIVVLLVEHFDLLGRPFGH